MSWIKPVASVDGEIMPLDAPALPLTDRGFLYGDSVYEVFRTYSGVPFMLEEHLDRMAHSAELMGMRISQSREEVVDRLRKAVRASGARQGDDVYVRFHVTRGGGAVDLYPEPGLTTRLVIMVKDLPAWNPVHYETGMKVAVTDLRRNPVNALDPNIKGGNYLNNIMGLTEAREAGADDSVMLNEQGLLTECSNSNIWFVVDGRAVTPREGNLVGLTRRTLLDLLPGNGIEAEERDLRVADIRAAEECFVTSATREVMPVVSLQTGDGDSIGFPAGGGEVTRLARKLFSGHVADYVARRAGEAWF
ncbi:MAG: aminotransferase class IV [Pseudomonadota bacterium]|nr:aminotransferase class IV [Pseudomonadota bacterium]